MVTNKCTSYSFLDSYTVCLCWMHWFVRHLIYYFRFQHRRIAGTSGGIQRAQSGSLNYEKSGCYIFLDFNSKIISCDPTIFSDFFVFCSRMFWFILQTSECFPWVSLTYNHWEVATVCWYVVTSVENISSCESQKSSVIVSFLWSTVRCLLRTDHNKKVKPPVSHAPISR